MRDEISKRTSNEAYIRFATKVLTTPRDEELIADRRQVMLEKMTEMEERLFDGRTWLCDEAFMLADIALGPRVEMFPVIGIADIYQRFARIGKFMERVKARPSWAASAVRPEPGETERTIGARAAA
jgi:glutathione S-transferase